MYDVPMVSNCAILFLISKQAGAELRQAQPQLGLTVYLTLVLPRL